MYKWPGMQKITQCQAFKLFGKKTIYLLYDDDTECEASSLEEIANHQGEYGYEKENLKFFKVPVVYTVKTIVEVTADTEENAIEWLNSQPRDFELPLETTKGLEISMKVDK